MDKHLAEFMVSKAEDLVQDNSMVYHTVLTDGGIQVSPNIISHTSTQKF
jgi:hypothetical protein